MPTAMPGGAVDEEIGEGAGQHQRLFARAVVVGDEIHRILVDVLEEFLGQGGHAHFGVTFGGRRVAVDGAEVALPVDQDVAHGEILRQAHDGVVNRGRAVGMVVTRDVAGDLGRFAVGFAGGEAEVVHAHEDAAVDGLQAVAHVRQAPGPR